MINGALRTKNNFSLKPDAKLGKEAIDTMLILLLFHECKIRCKTRRHQIISEFFLKKQMEQEKRAADRVEWFKNHDAMGH